MYKQIGDPTTVLEKIEIPIPSELRPNELLVQMLAAPINPADINTIQGVYGIKPKLPAFAGMEGVGKVIKVGSNVRNVTLNDWVLNTNAVGQHTWITHTLWEDNEIIKIPNDTPLLSAATLSVNPCTAYRMLNDFVKLEKGDVIIQNGANSAVGQAVIQIARQLGVITVNIIRSRPNLEKLKDELFKMGANHVITEEELRNKEFMSFLSSLPALKLGFNCVGGKSTTELMKYLGPNSTLVTYGAMSRQPFHVGAASLIFKNIAVRGFWMTHWKRKQKTNDVWEAMINELVKMSTNKTLLPPKCTQISLDDYKIAIGSAMESFIEKKFVFVFE
uniref:Enoyl-[acyl-carrier-protein] reductase, mitochondrial n=1 Tax=Strigamia maritima TaxID=126957 RepID=T1JCA9_STRMM